MRQKQDNYQDHEFFILSKYLPLTTSLMAYLHQKQDNFPYLYLFTKNSRDLQRTPKYLTWVIL